MTEREEALLRQIEELQQQTMQLQKLSTVGELAFSITHEFNNILTTVINYAKLGLRHKDEENRNKSFNKILAAGQRASRITTSLLAYARQKSNQRDLADVTQVVEDLLVLVEKDLQKHRISLVTQFDGHPQAMINVGQIQQVLMNLIINARQAMDEGGKLTLQVRKSSDPRYVEIVVKDSGCGIPKDKLAKIFDRFFSTKTADDQGQGGSGLGLALAREVIEAHEGRIRVESTVGKGTAFILKLQLAQVEETTSKAPPAGTVILSGQKLR